MAVARAPTGSSRNAAPCAEGADCARAGDTPAPPARPASVARASRLERLCPLDEHDRDTVVHRVAQLAAMAHQLLEGRRAVLELALALGAHEESQQVWRQAH